MQIAPFRLERYFARHEFRAPHLMSCSDCEPLGMQELLAGADEEVLELWRGLGLGYTESAGHSLLRTEVAARYREVDADDVLVVAPVEGIFLAMNALLAPGDHVVCTEPGYQALHEVARALGAHVTPWRPREEETWRFDLEDLAPLLRTDTRLLVVNFPHNPTGALLSREEYAHLFELARSRGCVVLGDEMYRLLERDPEERLEAACDMDAGALSLSGLSKNLGLPGLRIGWLATRDRELLARCAGLRDYTTLCSSAPSEVLAMAGLRQQPALVARNLRRIEVNLAALEDFARGREDVVSLRRPRAGSVCFPRLAVEGGTAALCERLVEERGVMLLPSTLMDAGDDHVRLGLGRDDLPEILARLGEFLAGRG